MSADEERDWWNALEGDQILTETAGVPPYAVDAVVDTIMAAISGSAHFMLGGDVNVLDLGCGVGRLTNAIADRIVGPYTWVIGVDIAASLIYQAEANAHPRARYLLGDGRRLPGVLPSLHAAYSVTMFQHIPHDAMWGYIRQVHDLLEPGGTFVFTIAQGDSDVFLNHQWMDLVVFGTDLATIFDRVTVEHQPDERGWHWVTARKTLA